MDLLCFTVLQASQSELMVMTVSEIVHSLIEAHEQGKDVNLNRFASLYHKPINCVGHICINHRFFSHDRMGH